MSDTVTIQISKSLDFTPITIVKEVTKDFDHTSTLDTMVEIEANELRDKYTTVYGRAKYNLPDSTGVSKWSDTRTFGFEGSIEKYGICFNKMNYSSDSIKIVDIDGNFINTFDFRNTRYYKTINFDLLDDFGNRVVEFPTLYTKLFPNGIAGSQSQGKPIIMCANGKSDDTWRPHFAFHSRIINSAFETYSNLRFFKYPCSIKSDTKELISIPDESKYATGKTLTEILKHLSPTSNRYSEIVDESLRFLSIADVAFLRIIMILMARSSNPANAYLEFNNNGNDVFGINEMINSKYFTQLYQSYYHQFNNSNNVMEFWYNYTDNLYYDKLNNLTLNYTHVMKDLDLHDNATNKHFNGIQMKNTLLPNEPIGNIGSFISTIKSKLNNSGQSRYDLKIGGEKQTVNIMGTTIDVPGSIFTYQLTDDSAEQIQNKTYRIVYNKTANKAPVDQSLVFSYLTSTHKSNPFPITSHANNTYNYSVDYVKEYLNNNYTVRPATVEFTKLYNRLEEVNIDGDIFIKVPKFWHGWYSWRTPSIYQGSTYSLSLYPIDNKLVLHPAFLRKDKVLDYVYIAKHLTTNFNRSLPNSIPTKGKTLEEARELVKKRNPKYKIVGWRELSLLRSLVFSLSNQNTLLNNVEKPELRIKFTQLNQPQFVDGVTCLNYNNSAYLVLDDINALIGKIGEANTINNPCDYYSNYSLQMMQCISNSYVPDILPFNKYSRPEQRNFIYSNDREAIPFYGMTHCEGTNRYFSVGYGSILTISPSGNQLTESWYKYLKGYPQSCPYFGPSYYYKANIKDYCTMYKSRCSYSGCNIKAVSDNLGLSLKINQSIINGLVSNVVDNIHYRMIYEE